MQLAALSEKQIVDELSDDLPPEETSGLALLFRPSLARLL